MSASNLSLVNFNLPRISVVVACWNVEKYIANCVDSILSQTYGNIEIILVDDCSSDGTLSILNEYALKDTRIVVVQRNKNGGRSECRNSGIAKATGDLISFVDGDDALEKNAYQEIIDHYDDSVDVYWFGINVIYEANEELRASDDSYYKVYHSGIHQIRRESLLEFDCSVCNKVFKRKFFEQEFKFKGLYYEDALFFMKFFALSRKVFFIQKKLYLYYRHPSSIMANTFEKKEGIAIYHLFILDDLYRYWVEHELLPESRLAFQKIVLAYFQFAYEHSPSFERARVVAEMVNRLRKWDIGSEVNSLLEYIQSGVFNISFGPQPGIGSKKITIVLPPLKGWQKIFAIRNECGHYVVRLFTIRIASWKSKS